ncbi:MAG: ATP-binding protein, partial [Lachnospiraceae bacterium]|nr:ATP-binding protein [Lachnospiraceae bacterium]
MADIFGRVVRNIILSFSISMSCRIFYETIVPRRKLRYGWMEHTTLLAFTAGFIVIAMTEIPPYILQPVRFMAVVAVVAQFYFQMSIIKNLILSAVLCGIYWLSSLLFISMVYMTPIAEYAATSDMMEPILDICFLCLMLAFRYRYQSKIRGLTDIKWGKLGLFSIIGIAVSIAVAMMPLTYNAADYYARLTTAAGFAVVYILGFYYMVSLLEKESQMQKLRLLHEQTQNQMDLYQSMKKRYEQQRRFSHDYKNQLNCIQGMI